MKNNIIIRKEIAGRLKQAREQAGYTSAAEFCKKNNLLLNEYLIYEKGEKAIKFSKIRDYAKLLQVSLEWLFIGA